VIWVIWALLLVPALAGSAALAIKGNGLRRALLLGTAVVHLLLTAAAWALRPGPTAGGWLALDAPGLFYLAVLSLVFLAGSTYLVGFLAREAKGRRVDIGETGVFFRPRREASFTACLLFMLSAMTLAAASQHFGLLWVAVEGSTLAAAPLIFHTRSQRSLEATWKYLVLCSVGVALALLGNFFLAVAFENTAAEPRALTLGNLLAGAGTLNLPWLKAAFLFFLIGYGSKMGLAPMHSWLPDAYSEAPAGVAALLSGALSLAPFLGLLRMQQVCAAAGIGAFGGELLVGFGLVSMLVAAVFILGQSDYKRMLAYSSVEHMGILAFGVGIGGAALFGAVLHTLYNSLAKGMMFFLAGNIYRAYKTRNSGEVRGLLHVLPLTGVLWVAGFLAMTGSPPFGPFLSELAILKGTLDVGRNREAALFLLFLALNFIGMATPVLRMAQTPPDGHPAGSARRPEGALAIVPPAALALLVLVLGVWIPPAVNEALREVARALGGAP